MARKRTIKAGVIEAVVRNFAASLTPEFTGPKFSWQGSFADMAAWYASSQLALGWFKVRPDHEDEIEHWAWKVAGEMADADPARAACRTCASRVVHHHEDATKARW